MSDVSASSQLVRSPNSITEDETVQVVVSGYVFKWLRMELVSRQLGFFPIPVPADDLPTFGISVHESGRAGGEQR